MLAKSALPTISPNDNRGVVIQWSKMGTRMGEELRAYHYIKSIIRLDVLADLSGIQIQMRHHLCYDSLKKLQSVCFRLHVSLGVYTHLPEFSHVDIPLLFHD